METKKLLNNLKHKFSGMLCLMMLLGFTTSMWATNLTNATIYMTTEKDDWSRGDERYAVYCYGDGEAWYDGRLVEGSGNTDKSSKYEFEIGNKKFTNCIFCRMNGSTSENNWNNKWDQTGDLTYDGTNNLFTVNTSTWSTYPPTAPDNIYLRGPIYEGECWPADQADKYHKFTKNDNVYTLTFTSTYNTCEYGPKEFILSTNANNDTRLRTDVFTYEGGCETTTRDDQDYNFRCNLDYTQNTEITITITWQDNDTYKMKIEPACTPPTITASDPAAICGSGKPEMTASTTAGTIHWYSDAACTSELRIGTSYTPSTAISTTTKYYLKAIDGDCASDVKTLTATINPLPTASISGNDAVCQNSSLQLTGSGGTSYSWNGGAYAATSTYNVTTTSTGQQTITLKVKDANGCESANADSKKVTVNAIPSISSIAVGDGNNECGTGTVTFNCTDATSGATIQWYENSTKLSEGTATSYTLKITDGSSRTLKAKAVKDGCESGFTEEATGSRKANPVVSKDLASPTAYEVITLSTDLGTEVTWSKTDANAYFVKDQQAVGGNEVTAETIVLKAPAGNYSITTTKSGECDGNINITIGTAEETCK